MASTTTLPPSQDEDRKAPIRVHRLDAVPVEALKQPVLELFENYSHIPRDEVNAHVLAIRDKAWDIMPYCCVGRFTFVELSVGQAPQYSEVLQRIKAGERYLDVGCCFGQDIRKLVYDGAPAENIIGTDLEGRFFPLGHELFNDGESLKAQFLTADILDSDDTGLDHLEGAVSIIHASSFFHLFDYAGQMTAAKRCVQPMKHQPGSLIFGRQSGAVTSRVRDNPILGGKLFMHDAESWQKMWQEVGDATGTKWKVEVDMNAEIPEWLNYGAQGDRRRMRYACWMI